MKIAHLSDIHFGAEQPEIVDALLIRLKDLDPDLVVASGDFTMAARHREFLAATRLIEAVEAPVLATPGNHDIPVHNLLERFTAPFKRYRKYLDPITCTRHRSADAAILSVTSARPWDVSFNWSHGRFSRAQIERTDAYFADCAGCAFRALVVHHPFYVPEDLPGFRTIGNGEAMLATLALRRVHVVFAGHLHRHFRTSRRMPIEHGFHEVTVMQVATAASSRRRDQPNAFDLVTVTASGVSAATQIWDGSGFRAEPAELVRALD